MSTFDRQRAGAPGTTRCVITGAYSANASAPGPRKQRRFQNKEQGLLIFDRVRPGARLPGHTRLSPRPRTPRGRPGALLPGHTPRTASAPGPPGTTRCVYTGAYSAYRVGPWPPKITPRRHSACYARSTVLCHVRDSRAPAREYGDRAANSSFRDGVSRSETEFAAQSRTGTLPGAVQRANTAGRPRSGRNPTETTKAPEADNVQAQATRRPPSRPGQSSSRRVPVRSPLPAKRRYGPE